MKDSIRVRLAVFILPLLLGSMFIFDAKLPISHSAGPWFVSPSGNDNNDCLSPAAACRTIGVALNKASSGDTINLAAGTYAENPVISKRITLSGAGSSSTIINGTSAGRVLTIEVGATAVEISGLRITNGFASGIDPDHDGGGVYISSNSNVSFSNVEVVDNKAEEEGGGVYNRGTLTIIDSKIEDNVAEGSGGGIRSYSDDITIIRSSISGNSAGGLGGGIHSTLGEIYVSDSEFFDNSVSQASSNVASGGALYLDFVSGHISNSIFENNSANAPSFAKGGGIYFAHYDGNLTLVNVTIQQNSSVSGGGLYNNGGGVIINNSTFSNNQTTQAGGGIYNSGTLAMNKVSVTGNISSGSNSGSGGGLINYEEASIIDSNISNNTATISGGGLHNAGKLTLIGSQVTNNVVNGSAAGSGGGIGSGGMEDSVIISSVISNNSAVSHGGGINGTCQQSSALTIIGSSISGNVLTGENAVAGAGLDLVGCRANVIANNISSNTAPEELSSGVGLRGGPNVSAHANCISGNSDTAVFGSVGFDVTGNWWGDPSGPAPNGSGDSVGLLPEDYYSPPLPQAPKCGSGSIPAPPPLPAPGSVDLRVVDIEVIQVVVTDTVLIADKQTLIRVHVSASGAESVPYVTARLYIEDAQGKRAVDQTFGDPYITAHTNPDSNDLADTINFLPDPSWLNGDVILTAEVDPYQVIEETDEDNNESISYHKSFENMEPLNIRYVSIPFKGAVPDAGRIATSHRYLNAVYPLSVVNYVREPNFVPSESWESAWGDDDLSYDVIGYLNFIYKIYEWSGWPTIDKPDQLLGWLPSDTWGLDGRADPKWVMPPGDGRVAYATDTSKNNTYAIIMAHEIAHNLGRLHPFHETARNPPPDNYCDRLDPNWPYDDNNDEIYDYSINVIGFDFGFYETKGWIERTTDDLMIGGHCKAEEHAPKWVSAYTYEGLYHELMQISQETRLGVNITNAVIPANQPILLINGRIDSEGTAVLNHSYQFTTTQPITQSVGSHYCLTLEDNADTVLRVQS